MLLVKKYHPVFILLFIALISSCHSEQPGEKKEYANIFKPLDGTWKGKFYIYEDTLGQRKGTAQPKDISYEYLKSLPLKLKSTIKAKHIYESESPYLQKGKIIDTYFDANGKKQEIISTAINKVENGKISCVVNKPKETVVHQGEYLGNNTIVWHRSIKKPKRIEHFREMVDSLHYRIVGWGYYGNDDPNLTPRTWFYGDYIKR